MNREKKGRVLIVDGEPNSVEALSMMLSEEGYEVIPSNTVEYASRIIGADDIDAVITDLKIPGGSGMYSFEHVTMTKPDVPVIVLTAFGTIESAVSAMTRGAFYFFTKPPDTSKLKGVLAGAVEEHRLKKKLDLLDYRPSYERQAYRIVGSTSEIHKTFETMEAVKDSMSCVLIYGETGTGKELVARALHQRSRRSSSPFIAVNCAAIPGKLIEAELFGCEKGAFTGAVSRRIGKLEEAGNGVIFLDEISELDMSMQAKLLRVLQEREIERIGSNRKIKVGFRLISATNRDLAEQVKNGRFREDLYYRINVIEIRVPPLRERKDDIPLLADAFLSEFCEREKKKLILSREVMKSFLGHHWPGNVRQLKNVMERAVVLARSGKITLRELPGEFLPQKRQAPVVASVRTLKELELTAIRDTLRKCNGNKSRTAKMLGISRKAFYKRLKESAGERS